MDATVDPPMEVDETAQAIDKVIINLKVLKVFLSNMKLPRVQMMITSVKIILIGRTHTLWDNAGNNIKSRILRIVDKIWQQAKVGPEEMAEAATMEEMDVKKELTSKLEDPFKPSLSTRKKIQQSIH